MNEERTSKTSSTGAPLKWTLNRRGFFKVLGSGIVILFKADALLAQERAARPTIPGHELPTDFNAFLRIGEDGHVSCFTGKIEMGQGVVTSLAQMLADELDVSMDQVTIVMGDTDLCPWDMGTFGSMSTRFFGPPLREAAAEARSILLALAAEHLKVPESRLIVRDGVISDKMSDLKKVTYTELTRGKRIERHLTTKPALKKVSEFKIMGKAYHHVDGVEKVTGSARYAGDIRLPGMLHAKILRPPAHGARLKSVDISALRDNPEFTVIDGPDLVAVCHSLPDVAEKALLKIKAEWDVPESRTDNTTIHDHLMAVAPKTGSILTQGGDLTQGEKSAVTLFEETYLDHYVAHAAMETHAATANFEGDRLIVWPSTQNPFALKDSLAQALRMPPEKVRVITPYVGGGFGGKTFNLQAIEAARLAKLTGKPIQVMWNRREEFFNDTFRPASIIRIRSGLDGGGRIVFWRYDVYYAGSRGAEQIYAIPHHRETVYGDYNNRNGAHPFATGAWRAPGKNSNTFARESQIDTMAARIKEDPVAFRLKHFSDQRMIATLKAAAAKFGWKSMAAPSGRGHGVACLVDAGTCVAAMAEVEVDRMTGKVAVKRIVCAQDMGGVINPEGARLQLEGSLTMGLGYALSEIVDFQGGQIRSTNFNNYALPRFSWLPKIETVLVENPEYPPQGGGEPAIPAVGAVIGNAIFDAAGIRLTKMPMIPVRVKEALSGIDRTK